MKVIAQNDHQDKVISTNRSPREKNTATLLRKAIEELNREGHPLR